MAWRWRSTNDALAILDARVLGARRRFPCLDSEDGRGFVLLYGGVRRLLACAGLPLFC
jgi:hypothetical protein